MTIEKFPSWGHLPEYDNLKARLLSLLPDRPFHPDFNDFYMLEKDEQRIAMVVCDSTKLTLTEWEKLSLPERVPWLEKVIKTYDHLVNPASVPVEHHVQRLVIDVNHDLAILDGVEHPVASKNALLFLQVLSEHPNEWISGADLGKGKFGDEYIGLSRPDKLKKFIPSELLAIIESQTGAGSKLVLSRK